MKMDFRQIIELIKNPQTIKYIFVGFLGSISVLSLTILFTSFFGIFYAFSVVIAFEISLFLGFFVHDRWTFGNVEKTSKPIHRFIKYNIFSLTSLGLNELILIPLTSIVGINFIYSEIIAIVVVFFFNFTTSKKIAFKN
jgi:dolichol-phosphate mannosyltransferase